MVGPSVRRGTLPCIRRPGSPIGRGNGLKIRTVWVRVPPGARPITRARRPARRTASSVGLDARFTFPGQGSQRPAWAGPWVDHESWELVEEASEVAGRDVAALLLDADADELRDTRNAQLTTFVSSLMVLDAVERLGIEPSFCAGHSLGEYTALTATGALGFDDGVRLVAARADAMHEAGLAQPGHDGRRARPRRRPGRRRLPPRRRGRLGRQLQRARARSSSPAHPTGVAAASAHAKELGAKKVMPLQVSGAFHTPFMTAARNRLREAIAEADPRDTEVPVVSNVDALPHHEGKEWASLLSAQLSSPVRWKQCLHELEDLGVTDFAELGPGGVLTGMAKRTVDGRPHDLRRHARGPRQAARVGRATTSPSRPGPPRGRAPLRQRAPRRQPRRRHLHPAAGPRRRHDASRSAPCSATSASTRCARRSPACCRATSPSPPSG